jgi:hypothetical protein
MNITLQRQVNMDEIRFFLMSRYVPEFKVLYMVGENANKDKKRRPSLVHDSENSSKWNNSVKSFLSVI